MHFGFDRFDLGLSCLKAVTDLLTTRAARKKVIWVKILLMVRSVVEWLKRRARDQHGFGSKYIG